MRQKKSLGQNFLTSRAVAEALVNASGITKDDVVVEVGPGKGAITELLLPKARVVIAVEKDKELVEYLDKKFAEYIAEGRLALVHDDILTFNHTECCMPDTGYKVVGAIPYYITNRILRRFLEDECQPETIALIIQKEVSERILARNGKNSLLSLSVRAYGMPRHVQTVKAGSFYPRPKVDSAILVIENISKRFFQTLKTPASMGTSALEKEFFALLASGFGSRRKMLATNLKKTRFNADVPAGEILKRAGIPRAARAEDLSLEGWRRLFLEIDPKSEYQNTNSRDAGSKNKIKYQK